MAHAAVAGLTQLLWLSYAPIATEAAGHYDVSVGAVGWLTNVFPLLYVVLAVPAGLALDRWPRPTMLTGAALVAAGAVVRAVFGDYAGALAGQVLVSLAQPILLGGVAVIAATLLPAAGRATGIAVGSAGVFAGLLLGIAMPTAIGADHIDALLTAQAVLGVIGAAALAATLRSLHRSVRSTGVPGTSPDVAHGTASPMPGLAALRTVVRDPLQRTLLILSAGGFGAFVALLTWLQALLEPRGIEEDTSGVLLLVLVLAGFVTTAFLPALAARRRREVSLLLVALPAAAVGCIVLAVGPPLVVTGIALALIGAVLLPALPVMLELAEQRAEALQAGGVASDAGQDVTADRPAAPGSGAASALLWLSGNLGGFAAALAVGALLHAPAAGFGLVGALTLVVALTAGRRLRRLTAP